MKTILLIEDDAAIRSNLVEILDLEGYRVLEAGEGVTGICKAKTDLPDLILCDIQMPEMDGYAVLEALRAHPATAAIPLIFLTARVDRRAIRQGMNLGADDYLTKPCSAVDLLEAIACRLKKQQTLTQLYAKEQEQAIAALRRSVLRDPLTDLPTRGSLCQQLQEWLNEGKGSPIAVLCLNIHRFRTINASFGNTTGDILLQMFAHRLKKATEVQGIAARLNGDEFGIAVSNASDPAEISALAQRILDAVSLPYLISGNEIRIQASLGIAISSPQQKPERLLTQAETAQSWCQHKGSCQYRFYQPGMDDKDVERRFIEMDLSRAIDRSEFQVYYQPQVNSTTGEMIGVEALLRWNHPRRGLISPSLFIPMAEELGLIVPLGEWVLRTACQQVQRWQQLSPSPIRVSVNLSMRQLQQPDLVDRVSVVLEETGLDPSLLVLELTETLMMQDAQQTRQTLWALRELGIGIAIDDFGTGYSSLNYLNQLPINGLKLDRSFIKEVETNDGAATISTAIIAMAQSLRLKIVAEGVETLTQLSFLRDRGCQTIQGFLYSPPLPAAEIQALLQTKRRLQLVGAC